MSGFDYFTAIAAGFSVVAGPLLWLAYLWPENFPARTRWSVLLAGLLTLVLLVLQSHHLLYATSVSDAAWPIAALSYRALLFIAPSLFFCFGVTVVNPEVRGAPLLGFSLLPALFALLPLGVGLPLLLLTGAGFSAWLSWQAYQARDVRPQAGFERVFSLLSTCAALAVLAAGCALVVLDHPAFFGVYAGAIAAAYALVVFAFVAIPGFIAELFESTRLRYASSSLGGVDVEAALSRLDTLMMQELLYTDSELNLSALAGASGLTSHQLSELLNARLGKSFPHYLRDLRVAAAQKVLLAEPGQSVLSVALEVGFRSQSTFYAGFKEATGMSPGEFRKRERTG